MTDASDNLASPISLLDALTSRLQQHLQDAGEMAPDVFLRRLDTHGSAVCELLLDLYGERDDVITCIEQIFLTAAEAYTERPADLRVLDDEREQQPDWYQHHTMMGAVCYVEQFAGTLEGLRSRIPYFRELALTYLHLMPLFRTPPGPDDGGYAVSSYRDVNPGLGTIADLRSLAADLRNEGISLVLDFVFNHTANDHEWALKARQGDPFYQRFYFMFDDREQPDAYEQTLREIFPDEHPGAFTFFPDVKKWVWTTFHTYQWDLNYRNPAVFEYMLREMFFLANLGTEVLRLDAVPFIWKELGTPCENLPQAHTIIRAFNALRRIVAPAMIFKSEAIVHPDDVVAYLGTGEWAGRECEISYNPLLMVSLWEALATRHVQLLELGMQRRFDIPQGAAWVNYVRSHDDIGWGFADEDATELGIHGFYHRQYLNKFYTGEEDGSFAVGFPFQFNPRTLDMRISGTTASLAGLEKALREGDEQGIELAIRRILLIYGIALSHGGIPLLYLGDEVGRLNDYAYLDDPRLVDDSRWVHRPPAEWDKIERRHEPGTIQARIFEPLQHMIALRQQQPAFGAGCSTTVLDTDNPHVYGFVKAAGDNRVLVLASFIDNEQTVNGGVLSLLEGGGMYHDLISEQEIDPAEPVALAPYDLLWIICPHEEEI